MSAPAPRPLPADEPGRPLAPGTALVAAAPARRDGRRSLARVLGRGAAALVLMVLVVVTSFTALAGTASAQPAPEGDLPTLPTTPQTVQLPGDGAGPTITAPPPPAAPTPGQSTTTEPGSAIVDIDLGGDGQGGESRSIVIILVLTVLSVAPSLLVLVTPFTRIVIVFSLTRNALGVQTVPPNQVIVGLALFLSIFIMGPTLSEMNEVGLQPLLDGTKTEQEAFDAAQVPLKSYMLKNTRNEELELFLKARAPEGDAPVVRPEKPEDIDILTLAPAYVLSEVKSAFIIGFVIFVPFLVIDLVVGAVLMALGMMMLPPVYVSLPFKILVFVMVGGFTYITETLMTSFHV